MSDFEAEPMPELDTGYYDFVPAEVTPQPEPQPEASGGDQEPPDDESPVEEEELTEEEKDEMLRMTYELRSQVGEEVLGLHTDEDWDRMVQTALDEAGYKKPDQEPAPEEPK